LPILGLAAAYFLAGQLAYLLESSFGYASLSWPPAGIALAGILIYGYRAWPQQTKSGWESRGWGITQEALRKAGALQNAIFNSANFSSIATDVNGVIQIFNVGAEHMLGYSAAEVMNIMTPAELSDAEELILRADSLSLEFGAVITPGFEALVFKAALGIEDIYELTYICKDGRRFPAVVSVTALRDDNDRIIGYLLIGTDNTARKQAEEALRKASALQNAIFNSANFSSIATDANGVIQIFNVGAERMLGYSAAEVMNTMTPADLSDAGELILRADSLSLEFGAAITPGFEALIFKAARGIEDIYELTYIRKGGSRFPAVVSVTALRDDDNDRIIGYLLIGTDNTARKQDQYQIKKLLQAVEQNPTVIVITDLNAKIEYVNEQFVNSSGYAREEAMGENPRFLQSGDTPETTYIDMWTTLGKGNNWQGEFINKSKQGIEYRESALISPIRDTNGKITHYLAIKEDITERKQNEAIVLLAKERAEALAISKTQFLANMSHEIRTPMSGIIGFSELALLKDMPADIRDYVTKINRASTNLLGILNDILDLSKLEAKGINLNPVLFDLDELRDTLYNLFADAAQNKGLVFNIKIPAQMPRKLIGDDLRLKQVLINLLSNAVKFTSSGAVSLGISLLDSEASKARVLFTVKDTGIGLSSQDQEKLFQPFTQADDSISRRFGGTGLGLALSHNLVQLMGGDFTVVSTPGLGSSFSFELVLGISAISDLAKVKQPVATTASALEDFAPRLAGTRVLVAEDNFFNQQIVQELLQLAGVQVEIANNGAEALAMLESGEFDAILMDVHMPVMNGLDATQQIRRSLRFADMPVIALTAGVTEAEYQQCVSSGMNDFINKPINMTQLLSTLVQWIKPQ
jgi:PAS domain S-box-containing protein